MLAYNVLLMLNLTLIVASLTLLERKLLSLVQRRVGPNFVGYKGRLQYIADALKLLAKGLNIPYEVNKLWFIFAPSTALALCYSFWVNSVWGPSLSLFDIEYNIVYASLLSVLFGISVILTGYVSKNKYAVLGSVRSGILMLNLEIFLGLLFLNIVLFGESFSFTVYVIYQEYFWFIIIFFNFFGMIIFVFLLEVNRAPFDLAEAESELVAGYNTEYGGFYFAIYYLGEYFHLFFFSIIIATLFFGGWEAPNLFFFISGKYLFNFCF